MNFEENQNFEGVTFINLNNGLNWFCTNCTSGTYNAYRGINTTSDHPFTASVILCEECYKSLVLNKNNFGITEKYIKENKSNIIIDLEKCLRV